MVNGHPRVFVIYDECKTRLFGTICEEPQIKLTYTTNNLAATWFSNSYDVQFHNQQDTVATSINPLTGESRGIKRLTLSSNETEADPLLGGLFIGDYIEAVLIKNRLYVGSNANYRKVPLLGGLLNEPDQPVFPVNQQDNYVFVTG